MQQYLPFTVLKLVLSATLTPHLVQLLQQYLPFTVLKLAKMLYVFSQDILLQQYLPFTVLKLTLNPVVAAATMIVATVLTVYGIETPADEQGKRINTATCCNSTYRLRY